MTDHDPPGAARPRAGATPETLTRAGLNLIQQALSIFDSDLRLAAHNRRYQEMFDLPDALVSPGTSFEDTIRFLVLRGEYGPQHDPETAVRQRVEIARAFHPHYMERERANGRWISVEGSPLPQGGWVTVYTDITEIKYQERLLRARSADLSDQVLGHAERLAQANRALAATNAALEEAKRELTEMEARTRLTTEMMPAHIAHVNRDLRYTYSNRRLNSVLPGRPSDVIGLHGREALGHATFERISAALDKALRGVPSVLEFTDDESGRRIRAAFTPDRIGKGAINGVYILSMDVTEEAQARAALAQTHKRELAAQLTSGLAHDFANLLTIILGLQGRLEKLDLATDARELVSATMAAARRGGVLLDRIGSISGKRRLRPVPTGLPSFLRDLGILAAGVLPPGIRLTTGARGIGGHLMLDAGSLQDALLNLILNARDAIGPRGGEIAVRIAALRDTWLDITVEDDGPGFTPEALLRGADPFFTTKGGEGSGLGLAMVYDFAKLAGGTIRLSNRPEGGARVILRLPLRPVAAASESHLVLLVEDNDEIRVAVREMLRNLGHNVIETASAEEAEALADLPAVDRVLSDITLPGGMSGAELAGRLAARRPELWLGLMTSLPQSDRLRQHTEARFAVLPKPFDTGQLAAFLDLGAGQPASGDGPAPGPAPAPSETPQ